MASEDCSSVYNITDEAASAWLYSPTDTIIITVIIPIFLGLGLLSNSTFLLVIFRIPKMRSDTNIILAHLAVSDLLFLVISAILYIWRYYDSIIIYSDPLQSSAGCSTYIIVGNTGYFASILLVTLVSFERYLAMCHPMKHLKIRGRKRTNRLIAICWTVGFFISVLTIPTYAVLKTICLQWPDNDMYRGFPPTLSYCGAIVPWVSNIVIPLLNFPWILTMVANIYMFACIVRALDNRTGADGRVDDDRKAQQVRNQVARMLVVNGVIFFICHIPYRVLSFSYWITDIAQIPNPLFIALGSTLWKWLPVIPQLINTVINPMIYGAMNAQYRQAFSQLFHCRTKKTNLVPTLSQTQMSVVQDSK